MICINHQGSTSRPGVCISISTEWINIRPGAHRHLHLHLHLHAGCWAVEWAPRPLERSAAGAPGAWSADSAARRSSALGLRSPLSGLSMRVWAWVWRWGWMGRARGVSFKLTHLLCEGRFFCFLLSATTPPPLPRKLPKPSTQKSKRINHHLPGRAHAH